MQEKIIYFEDDLDLANVVIEFLKREGFHVHHYASMPDGGLNAIVDAIKVPPFLVLMDIRLAGNSGDGFEICRQLKQDSFFVDVPVIFTSGLIEEDDILKAYEVGAHDYLTKPIKFKTLSAKCLAIKQFHGRTTDLKAQVSNSELVAFSAMTTSSELGEIIRFHDRISRLSTLEAVAEALVRQVGCFGLSSSVMFSRLDGTKVYCSDDGNVYELEKSVFDMLKGQGRVYSWSNRAMFNYGRFSVLIRSMPLDDEKRAGELRDQICLLLNGVESRVLGIDNESQLKENQENIRLIAQTIGKMVMDLQAGTLDLSERFEKIVHELEDDVAEDFSNLNLLQAEEKVVMDHIHKATEQALAIFEQARSKDAGYTKVLIELLEQLP